MNELKVFTSDRFGEVRTVNVDGETYFVGKDVSDKLGYQNGSRDIDRHVYEEDRRLLMVFDGTQNRNMICVNESGLYALIFGSKLDGAMEFKRWVTSEVLPQIRRTGSYNVQPIPDFQNPAEAARAWADQYEARQVAEKKNLLLVAQVAEYEPKANYCDVILQNPEALDVSQIAQDYGMSAVRFNKLLNEMGLQYRVNDQWILCGKHQGNGYVKNKTIKRDYMTRSKTFMQWTQKGRFWLYEKLKSKGYLPEIEQEEVTDETNTIPQMPVDTNDFA